MTLLDLWTYIRDGGTVMMFILILIGGWKKYWVWGWYAEELQKRNALLENRLERATRVGESSSATAQQAVRAVAKQTEVLDE